MSQHHVLSKLSILTCSIGIAALVSCSDPAAVPIATAPELAPSFALATQAVAAPTFTPQPGTYSSAVLPLVTIKTSTSGATIRYTTNGTDPTSNSTAYSGGITITRTTTLKARAFKSAMTTSSTTSGTYTITTSYIGPRSKSDALAELKSWLVVQWCQSNDAFALRQLINADAGRSLLASVLQDILTRWTPYSAAGAIQREVDRYSSKTLKEIDNRIAEIQKKLKTTDLQKAFINSWCS